MESDKVLSYLTQPTAKTTGNWFKFFAQIMEEVIKKRKSYFKLDKSLQKLMEVDTLEWLRTNEISLCGIEKNKSPVLSYVIAEGLKKGLGDAILSVN